MSSDEKSLRTTLAALVTTYGVANAFWLWENGLRCVGTAYHVRHFMRAAEFHVLLLGQSPIARFLEAVNPDRFYPAPLHSFTAALTLLFWDKSIPAATWSLNLLYFALALAFMVLLVQELGHPIKTAMSAIVLFALYPAVFGLSRLYGAFDFQVMAMMPAAVFFLVKAERFESRKGTVILSVVISTALLIKDTFAGYFGPLFFVTAAGCLFPKPDAPKLKNLGIFLVLSALLTSVYYADTEIIYKELTEVFREPSGNRYLLDDWNAYTVGAFQTILSPPFFLLFGAALWTLWKKKELASGKHSLLLTWIFAPWAIIFLMPHYKQASYFAPILPAIAILTSIGFWKIKRALRKKILPAAILIGTLQFYLFSFGPWPQNSSYFRMDPTLVFHGTFPVEIDSMRETVDAIVRINERDRRNNRVLVFQTPGHQTGISFFHFFNWFQNIELEPSGGVAQMFDGGFFEKTYDKVLLPLPEGRDLARYVEELYSDSMILARRNWMEDVQETLKKTTPRQFVKKLEKFLADFPHRERIGKDGDYTLWLLSRRPIETQA